MPDTCANLTSGCWARAMTIHRVLGDHSFDPDDIAILVKAYEDALRKLQLTTREDAATLICKADSRIGEGGRARSRSPEGCCDGVAA
jgi:hypothetical protein